MKCLNELVLIGLGLCNERDLSFNGAAEAQTSETVFAEFYTNFMPETHLSRLEKLLSKEIIVLSRRDFEEDCGKKVLEATRKGKTALLVPGDPLIATTHIDLRIRAEKLGIKTRIVHGASIVSAVIGLSGLQNYKYGRSVTIPFSDSQTISETPYNVIAANKKLGLHTLCYLDINVEEQRYMTIEEGLETLLNIERKKRQKVVTRTTIAVGIARAGSHAATVKSDHVEALLKYNFGAPPQSLILPGNLHFMEAEALITLAKAPTSIREMAK